MLIEITYRISFVIQLTPRDSKTIGKSMEQTKHYHILYLRAINNVLRRRILKALKEGNNTIEDLVSTTRLDINTLKWHLSILEHGFCIERDSSKGKVVFKLTQEGKVVDYLR